MDVLRIPHRGHLGDDGLQSKVMSPLVGAGPMRLPLLVGLTVALGLPAFAAPLLVELDAWAVAEPAYAAWLVDAPTGGLMRVSGRIVYDDFSTIWGVLYVLDAQGGIVTAGGGGSSWSSGSFLHLEKAPHGTLVSMPSQQDEQNRSLSAQVQLPGPGRWHVLFLHALDGNATGSLSLAGPPDATVVGVARGPTFMHRHHEFHGELSATQAGTLRVIRNATFSLRAEQPLYGMFYAWSNVDDLEMSYDAPAGTVRGDTSYELAGAEPGDYTFRIDRWNDHPTIEHIGHDLFGIGTAGQLFLFGAAVGLPQP